SGDAPADGADAAGAVVADGVSPGHRARRPRARRLSPLGDWNKAPGEGRERKREGDTMQLPIIDPTFTRTADAHERDVFHSFSKGICPPCRELVDGSRLLRAGKVFLRKHCPRCGPSEALISGDADWFLKSLSYVRKSSVPLKHSTRALEGCPHDCGLCPDHE